MPICFDDRRVVEPSSVARRLLWHALSVGTVWRDESESHPAKDKAGMFLFWVLSGKGELRVSGERYELVPGSRCWLVDMGTPRTYLPESGVRMVTAGVRFSGPGIDAWMEALTCGGEFELIPQDLAILRRNFKKIVQLVIRRPASYESVVHESLTQIMMRLLVQREVLSSRPQGVTPLPVARVLEAVLAEPARAWRASELADISLMSYSTLRKVFREAQQESLSEFIQRIRLDQARLLLADERMTIKEIAVRLNFSTEFYFSQWFRSQTGSSPSSYRATHRD